MPREAMLVRTLVELADSLVDDFDVVELLTLLVDRCVEVFDVAAAGLMLVTPGGELRSSGWPLTEVSMSPAARQRAGIPDERYW